MDWQGVERVIVQLEDCTQGRGTQLPSNGEIFAAFTFLERNLPDKDARYAALAQTLAAPELRLGAETAGQFRALYRQLETRRQIDATLDRCPGYVPNRIPAKERLSNLLFSGVLAAYAAYAVQVDDFYVPGKRHGLHLHGMPVLIMCAATLCAIIVFLAVVVDHYDTRPNERAYQNIGKIFRTLGWTLFVLALLAQLLGSFKR